MVGKNMILINSVDFQGVARSFKMVPIVKDCPYVECIFSVNDKILAVITKIMKQSYHFVPKLDDNGDPVYVKGKTRTNGKQIKEERRLVDTFSEFYIITPEEITGFIKSFAVNAKEFDFETILKGVEAEEDPSKKLFVPEKPGIVKEMPKA